MTSARHLHASHFAFLRGVVQGLDPMSLWGRYLALEGDAQDVRVVRRLTRQLRESFAVLALRAGKPGSARLLRLDLQALPRRGAGDARPTLDDFVAEHAMEDFPECEQLEAYEAVYGRAQREHAALRLMRRQLQLINDLSSHAIRQPRLEDELAAWLPARLHNRLREAGLMTLYGLARAMVEAPRTWMRKVPGIGQGKAQALEDWLREEGLLAAVQALPAVRAPSLTDQAALVLHQPGAFARADNLLGAAHDVQAVSLWLATLPEDTARGYRRQVERLALWSALTLQRPLSGLTFDDLQRYRDFLLDPQPQEQWVGPAGVARNDPRWRPFTGPLSPRTAAVALSVISAMFSFWVSQQYVKGNPVAGLRVHQVKRTLRQQFGERSLQEGDVEALLADLGDSARDRRLRLVVQLLLATGLRAAELLGAKFSDLEREFEEGQTYWVLYVLGKGAKVRDVDVPASVIEEAAELARLRGAAVDLQADSLPATPLLGLVGEHFREQPTDPNAPWSYSAFYEDLKKQAARTAQRLKDAGDAARAQRLSRMSGHWLRHTFGRRAAAADMDPVVLQQTLGHASLGTTSAVYLSVERKRRRAQMQQVWQAAQP